MAIRCVMRSPPALKALSQPPDGGGSGIDDLQSDLLRERHAYLYQGVLRNRSNRRSEEDRRPDAIMQGDDDQIVPFADAGLLQYKLVKDATLKVKAASHGMCTTHKDQVNEDLLAFCELGARRAA
jgi:pimeloyl-ACP methyl ester carboxylesterase